MLFKVLPTFQRKTKAAYRQSWKNCCLLSRAAFYSRLLLTLPKCCLLSRAALFSCLLVPTKPLPTYAGITSKFTWAPLLTHKRCSFATFTDPPEIIRKPQNQGVRVGGVASFYCAARGDPPPSIVWRKNGKKVSGKFKRYLWEVVTPTSSHTHTLNTHPYTLSHLQALNLVTRCWSNLAAFPYCASNRCGRDAMMRLTSAWQKTVWAMR